MPLTLTQHTPARKVFLRLNTMLDFCARVW